MITARVAYDYLTENAPNVLTKAEQILKPIQSMNEHELNHGFVECATFPDDIKNKGWKDQSPWHFDDIPYIIDNFNGTAPAPENFNVTWAVEYMHKNLKGPRTDDNEGVKWELGDSFNLRFLIHYVGDIH